ncbi:hypothetical protein QE152_g37258 [Popillia japonica]|uniref:Secreted protein n=1 Tax=Popillia japonica TaxID=7064 RepID=A0AAW1IB51_POPJA
MRKGQCLFALPHGICGSSSVEYVGQSGGRHVCATPPPRGSVGSGSSSVEYVGQSGGRHVCATPPPRGSVGSADIVICSDQCCTKRPQNTLALTVW